MQICFIEKKVRTLHSKTTKTIILVLSNILIKKVSNAAW